MVEFNRASDEKLEDWRENDPVYLLDELKAERARVDRVLALAKWYESLEMPNAANNIYNAVRGDA